MKRYTLKAISGRMLLVLGLAGLFALTLLFAKIVVNSHDEEKTVLRSKGGGVYAVTFSPDGETLATGCHDGTVELWEVCTGKRRATYPGSPIARSCHSVAFSPDGKSLASGSSRMIRYWDLSTEKARAKELWHEDFVTALAFSPDGMTLASGSFDSTVKLWEANGKERAILRTPFDSVYSVAFSPDGKFLAAGGNRGKLILWETATEKVIGTLTCGVHSVYALAFTSGGKTLASASSDGAVKSWEVGTQKNIHSFEWYAGTDHWSPPNFSAAFSPDGTIFVTCGRNLRRDELGEVWLYDVATGKQINTLTGHSKAVSSVAFSPDGNQLASGAWDSTVRFWDLAAIREAGK